MDSSALLKPNVTQELISVLMRSMLFATYANIIEIRDDSVVVQGSICDNLIPFTTTVKLIYPTTKFVQMAFKPEVGDKVLVVGLQSYSDKMFSADKLIRDVPENNIQHYTILGCVAIPLNIESDKAALRISNTDESITINEGDDPVVRWSELNTILSNLQDIFNNHTHQLLGVSIAGTASETGSFTGSITGDTTTGRVPGTQWTDTFDDLASEVLKVPAAGE